MERSILSKLLLSLKGVAMGAADVVPGVSGGTIAFITGIYEELITSINNINLEALKVLRKEGVAACWKHINGTFFLFLFAGIIVSIASLAKLVLFLLENHPTTLWSFFFGLIVASTWVVGKKVSNWKPGVFVGFAAGTAIAVWISSIQTVGSADASWYIFLSGCIAICAMILPGISGSFILVLLGSYHVVLDAIKNKEFGTILIFLAGCTVGILSFARLLKFLFTKYKNITIAILSGFMLGSLYKVWPWKERVGTEPLVVHSDGKEDWMMQNVSPMNFDGEPMLWSAIAFGIVGLVLVLVLDRFSPEEA